MQLRRSESFNPVLPAPIVAALTHLVVDAIAALEADSSSRAPKGLVASILVEASSPPDGLGMQLRVVDSRVRAVVARRDLAMRLVSVLVTHSGDKCEARCDPSGRTVVIRFDVPREGP
jgi:hypothetical protein